MGIVDVNKKSFTELLGVKSLQLNAAKTQTATVQIICDIASREMGPIERKAILLFFLCVFLFVVIYRVCLLTILQPIDFLNRRT